MRSVPGRIFLTHINHKVLNSVPAALAAPLAAPGRRAPEHLRRIGGGARERNTCSGARKCHRQNIAAMLVAVEPALHRPSREHGRIESSTRGIKILHDTLGHVAITRIAPALR